MPTRSGTMPGIREPSPDFHQLIVSSRSFVPRRAEQMTTPRGVLRRDHVERHRRRARTRSPAGARRDQRLHPPTRVPSTRPDARRPAACRRRRRRHGRLHRARERPLRRRLDGGWVPRPAAPPSTRLTTPGGRHRTSSTGVIAGFEAAAAAR